MFWEKRIDEINGKRVCIELDRNLENNQITYYKNLDNLNPNERKEMEKILTEVEEEFGIEFA